MIARMLFWRAGEGAGVSKRGGLLLLLGSSVEPPGRREARAGLVAVGGGERGLDWFWVGGGGGQCVGDWGGVGRTYVLRF